MRSEGWLQSCRYANVSNDDEVSAGDAWSLSLIDSYARIATLYLFPAGTCVTPCERRAHLCSNSGIP